MEQPVSVLRKNTPFYRLNLGARLTLSIGGSVLLASMALFAWLYHLQEAQALRQVETQAQALLSEMMVVRDWVSEYGDVWTTQPGELHVEGRDGFYRKSPGMVTKEISLISNAREAYRFHITSLELKNPDNAPDAFELDALHEFEENPETFTQIEKIDGQRYYRQMIPLYTQAACLECHPGYNIGDVRGGISVLVPMAEVDESLAAGRRALVGTAVLITLLMTGLLYWLVRRMVVLPLGQLRGVAQAMGQGNYQEVCELRTGDELQALGETFNQMAGSLKSYQDSLHAQIDRRTGELDALSRMALTISSGNNLEAILSEALEQALSATVTSDGFIRLVKSVDSEPTIIQHGLSPEMIAWLNNAAGNERCTLWNLQTSGQLLDLTADWPDSYDGQALLFRGYDYRSALVVPLRSANRTWGTLTILPRGDTAVSPEQSQFVACLGNQLGVAVENAYFQAEIERLAVLEERGRIARDLHDSLAQTLSWLHLKMDVLSQTLEGGDIPLIRQEANDVQQVVGQACTEMRESIDDLRRPPGSGLEEALSVKIAEFGRRSSQQQVQLSVDDACSLAPEMETEAVNILQEALTNVRKHSQAQQVDVTVQRRGSFVELSIRDDGRGFNPYHLDGGTHFGLQIMQERAERVGGSFYIYTAPGLGTHIVVSFPAETAVARPILAGKRYQ